MVCVTLVNTQTVSEWSKDNTVSFGLMDMIRRFRDCLGC